MGIYSKLEEKYYSLMDWIEEKGLKVYEFFVNPIESRGVPSFPIFVLLIALIAAGVFFLVSSLVLGPQNVTMRVSVSSEGNPLADVRVRLTVDGVDQPFLSKTDENGLAELTGIPAGRKAVLRVEQTGYDVFLKQIDSTSAATLSAELQLAPEAKKLRVLVTNLEGDYLGDAMLSYLDSSGTIQQYATDADGIAELSFASEEDIFRIKVTRNGFTTKTQTCFASQPQCSVELTPESEKPIDEGGTQETKGSVVVYVKDSDGNGIPAKVTVYDADSVNEIASGHSTESSPAFFQDAAAIGVSVYVLVEPIDAEHYASYNGGAQNDVQTVVEGTIEFRVTLEKQSDVTPTTSFIKIKAVDEKNNALEGATVTLLLSDNPRRVLLTQDTDATGEVSFQVANDVGVYATVYKTGFLPAVERELAPGDSKTLTLIELIPGNSGEVKAVVSDDDGNAVEFANVQAYYSDGFYAGIPSQDSAADGSTLFSGLPLEEELRFHAVHGTLKGTSDAFIPTIQETLTVPIRLEPATGVVRVKPIDVTTNSSIVATVTAFVDKTAIASCTNSQTPSCDLKVKANKPIVLKAQTTGYVQTTSETFTVLPESVTDKILLMLPTELSQELRVLDYRLMPSNADQVNVSGNLSVLDRGRYYKTLLTVNFPSGVDENGAFQRIGEAQTIVEDPAFFSYFEKPATAEIRFGQTYSPGPDCASDEANQNGETKWMDYAFPGTEFGVRTIAAKTFVRPTAESGSNIKFFYRAYSNANYVWIRKPVDAELNYSQRSPEKDECYAESYEKEYSIAAGQSTCSESACLTVSFVRGNQTVGNGLTVNIGDGFSIKINARAFEAINAPYVKVNVDKAVALGQYVFGSASGNANEGQEINAQVALDAENSVDGSIAALGNLPSQYASVSIQFGDEGGELVTAQRFVIVQGTGELVVVAQPGTIYANERNTLRIFVTRRSNGAAVTDARVSLKEVEGFPFDGSPNGVYDIQGDDTTDNGEGGIYVFKDLQPSSVGEIDAVAERTGFKKASARVRVSARDFLEFNPDISALQLSCDDQRVDVSTRLNVDVPVTMAFSGSPCVSVSGSGVSSAGFIVKRGKTTQLILTPLRNGQCYLTFNAVLTPSGAADSQTAWINVDCQALEPSPTPIVSVTPSACNSANCPACNEQECLYLSQYCEAKYVTIPGNVSQFKECIQKPTPTPVVPTPIPCGAGNCSACDEAQCTALLMTKSCMPMYKTQLAGYPGSYGLQNSYGISGYGTQNPGYGTQYNAVNSWPYYIPPGSSYYRQRTYDKCVTYKVPEECSPVRFNFGQILMSRLGNYHGQYLFNSGYKGKVTGLSAATKIFLTPQGMVPQKSETCQVSGKSIDCERTINPIVPTNAVAFSIWNSYSNAFTIIATRGKSGKAACYEFRNVDTVNTVLQNILGSSGSGWGFGSASLSGGLTNTWILAFRPLPGCVNYVMENGVLYAKPTDAASQVSFEICAVGLASNLQSCVTLNLKIKPYDEDAAGAALISKYALLYTPFTEYKENGDLAYDAIFVNNMRYDREATTTAINVVGSDLKFCTQENCDSTFETIAGSGDYANILFTRFNKDPSSGGVLRVDLTGKGSFAYDLAVHSFAGDDALKCSDDVCCNSLDVSASLLKVQTEVNEVFRVITSQLETVYYGNIIEGTLSTFNQAMDDSIADLEAQMFIYPLCKLLGTDPVTDLQIACSQRETNAQSVYDPYGVTPQTTGLLGAYGSGLLHAGCSSELFNRLMGQNLPPGTGWDFIRNQAAGAFNPGQGEYPQKRYVVPLKLWITVPFKKSAWTDEASSLSNPDTKAILDKLPKGDAVFIQSFHPSSDALASASDVWDFGGNGYIKNLEGRVFFPFSGGTSGVQSGLTTPFKEATGCLAYYLHAGSTQCDPGVYKTKQGNYCGDPVELPPQNNDALAIIINTLPPGTIGTFVGVPKSDVLTVKVGTTPFVLFNLDTQKDNAEKYGAAPPEKVGILTDTYGIVVPSAPTEAAKYACTPLPTTGPKDLSTLKYDAKKDNKYLAETYCAKIINGKLIFEEKYGKCSPNYKRYYVCVPLFSVPETGDCLKLRDVYSQDSLLPTMCDVSTDKSGADKTGNRCRSTATTGKYTCQLKESQKSTVASTAISSQSISCTLSSDNKLICSEDVGTCTRSVSPVQFQFTCGSTTLSCTETQGPTQNDATLLTCNKK